MALCPHGRRIGYVKCPICQPTFSEFIATEIGWQARHCSAGRWETAVEQYIFICGGSTEDARVICRLIRPRVLADKSPIPEGMVPEREVIRISS